jgi:hypothetical protein
VAHFSDIDMQGHGFGVDVKWNTANSYTQAVRNKTNILRRLFSAAPNGTTLVIVSDHGHVNKGGHGGVHQVLRDVPLIIYNKGSRLGLQLPPHAPLPPSLPQFSRAPGFNGPMYDNTDVAPTICALLGLPVPRTSKGRLIEEALLLLPAANRTLHLSDLLYQQIAVYTQWKAAVESDMILPPLPPTVSTADSVASLVSAIDGIRAEYDASRLRIIAASVDKNQLLNLLVADFVMTIIMLHALQRYTMADPWNAFRVSFRWVPCFGFHLSEHQELSGVMNVRAIAISLVLAAVYFLITVGTLLAITFGTGYEAWDSTLIHSPNAFVHYLGISLGPAFFYAMVHQRIMEMLTTDPTSMFVQVSIPPSHPHPPAPAPFTPSHPHPPAPAPRPCPIHRPSEPVAPSICVSAHQGPLRRLPPHLLCATRPPPPVPFTPHSPPANTPQAPPTLRASTSTSTCCPTARYASACTTCSTPTTAPASSSSHSSASPCKARNSPPPLHRRANLWVY